MLSALISLAESAPGTAERTILQHAEVATTHGRNPVRKCYASHPNFHADGLLPMLDTITKAPQLAGVVERLLGALGVKATNDFNGLTRAALVMKQQVLDGRQPNAGPVYSLTRLCQCVPHERCIVPNSTPAKHTPILPVIFGSILAMWLPDEF